MADRAVCHLAWAGLLLAAASSAPPVLANELIPADLIVETFGPDQGLPSKSITALHLDSAGFLWVGTREGLVRFDGYSSRLFEYVASDPDSLSDNYIRTIDEDRDERLWISTNAGGLNLLDRSGEKFHRFRHDPADPESLSHDCVFATLEDRRGRIWVATQRGLNLLDLDTGHFSHFTHEDSENGRGPPHDWIYQLHEDGQGRIWVATVGGGVAWFDPDRPVFHSVPVAEDAFPVDRAGFAFALAESPSGELFFGLEIGLYRLDEAESRLVHVPIPGLETESEYVPIVTDLAFDEQGLLWISTWRRGLFAYDPETGASRSYRHDPQKRDGLGSDRLQAVSVYGDDVWISTWGAGIHRFSSKAGIFNPPPLVSENQETIDRFDILAILEKPDEALWLGTFGSGLIRVDETGLNEYVELPDGSLTITAVMSLAEDPDGSIWIGAMSGLARLDPDRGVFEAIGRRSDEDDGLGSGTIPALTFDRRGSLWVGVGGSGVYRLEEDGQSFENFSGDPSDEATLAGEYVMVVREDADGAMWVGTRSGGLFRLDPEKGIIRQFAPDGKDARSLSHHYVSSILRGSDGVLSVGTIGGGVDRQFPGDGDGSFRHLTAADGLANQNVMSMLEDDDGSLWIATRRGLSRFEPSSGRVRSYLLGDGIRGPEFNAGAAFRGREKLYFGTSTGLVSIRRGTPFEEARPSPLRVVDIDIGAERWSGAAPPWRAERIEVAYGTPISIEFAVLDFSGRSRYEYRSGKESEDWIDLAEGRRLTFVDLSPGTHELEIRGRNSRGVPGEDPVTLTIAVIPPFWMTDWFRASVGMLLIAAVVLGHRVRTSSLKKRNLELTALQREREAALEEARRSERALQQAYERLRSLTRRLEDAKEEERAFIARELHDHMGQSLSAAKLDLKALGRLPDGSDREERLADALQLVDGMIQHVRTLSLDLRPPLLDELGLVAALRGYAEGQSMRTSVAIDVETNGDDGDVPPQIAITAFRIVQEAINNTLRHAEPESVTISVRRRANSLALTVRDDGKGFDVDAAIARAARGGHLGLLGMRERVEALGGRLEISSEPGSGSEVRAVVPFE